MKHLKLGILNNEYNYIFVITLFLYIALWTLNFSHYFNLILFLLYFFIINTKIKSFYLSFLSLLTAASVINSGKSYPIQIIAPGFFNQEIFPNGYLLQFTININLILACITLFIFARDGYKKIAYKLTNLDWILLSYYLWRFVSNLVGSQRPEVSILFYLNSLPILFIYFYIKIYFLKFKNLYKFLFSILSAIVVFESLIAFQQYYFKSPQGKSVEIQHDIEFISGTEDELNLQYSYRPGGTFEHANTLAINMAYWLIFIIAYFIKSRDSKALFILLLGGSTIAITLSRATWIGMFFSLLTIFYIVEKVKKIKFELKLTKATILIPLLALPLILFFVGPRAATSAYTFIEDSGGGSFRYEQLIATSQIIALNPIFGVGENMLITKALETLSQSIFNKIALDVHNWYLSLAANNGLMAVLMFLSFVLLNLKISILKIKRNNLSIDNIINLGYIGAVICFLAVGLFSAINGSYYIILFSALANHES